MDKWRDFQMERILIQEVATDAFDWVGQLYKEAKLCLAVLVGT